MVTIPGSKVPEPFFSGVHTSSRIPKGQWRFASTNSPSCSSEQDAAESHNSPRREWTGCMESTHSKDVNDL